MIRIGIAGLIGYKAAEKLLDENIAELTKRFSGRYIKNFRKLAQRLISDKDIQDIIKELQTENKEESFFTEGMLDSRVYIGRIGSGGLWASLWNACEYWQKGADSTGKIKNTGCKVELKDIYIRQEVIEISELYNENPYEIASEGALLVVWNEDKIKRLPEKLAKLIDKTSIIGYITEEKQRIITDGEMTRFLTPTKRQEKDIADRKTRTQKCQEKNY